MSSENTVYIAIELSVSSWLVAARLPNTNKARLHRLDSRVNSIGKEVS